MNATIAANIAKLTAAQNAGIEVLNFTAGGWAVGAELVRGSFEMVYPSGKTCSCGETGICAHILLVRWHLASEATRALALAEIAAAPVAA